MVRIHSMSFCFCNAAIRAFLKSGMISVRNFLKRRLLLSPHSVNASDNDSSLTI